MHRVDHSMSLTHRCNQPYRTQVMPKQETRGQNGGGEIMVGAYVCLYQSREFKEGG